MSKMKTIRAGRGLGDSIYLASICRHLGESGKRLTVLSDYPDVFAGVEGVQLVEPFRRINSDIVAHYAGGKGNPKTTQFTDMCGCAGIHTVPELRLPWREGPMPAAMSALGAPYICVMLPRAPMNRVDGFGAELMPKPSVLCRALDRINRNHAIVQVGSGKPMFDLGPFAADMANKTTVQEMVDIVRGAAGFFGYPSFMIPLAESFRKPVFCVWSSAGLKSRTEFIRQITPAKLLHHVADDFHVVDDWTTEKIQETADEFLRRLQVLS